ncbi:P-type conjugative transfer protein TrbL, partial [Acinetobacter baumannii]
DAAGTASSAATESADGPPAWAKAMKRRQAVVHGANVASHTLKSGDSHGGGAGPDITQKD